MTARTLDGRYELRARLGAGSAGEVWRAHDVALGRDVAVKLLASDTAADPAAAARFRTEVTGAAKINHPHAVTVYDAGHDQGDYLVMELVDGGTLADLLGSDPLPPDVVAALGRQLGQALGAAHARGLVHRDVTPGNVLLTAEGATKLADFGIAQSLSAASKLTAPGQVVGTARYLAPEQLREGAVDARADVFALGLVLHELATGQPPFGEGTPVEVAMRRLAEPLPRPRELNPDLPVAFDAAIARATDPDPAQRFADGNELAEALSDLAAADAAEVIAARLGRPRPASHDDATVSVATTAAVAGTQSLPASEHVPDSGAATTGVTVTDPAPSGRRRQAWGRATKRWAMAVVGVLVVVVAASAILRLDDDGDNGEPAVVPPAADATVAAIIDAGDHDPFGSGSEHPDDVGHAVDDDPTTRWQTHAYRGDPALGGLKPGVGVWLDLGRVHTVSEIVVETDNPGADFAVYAGDAPPSPDMAPDDWGQVAARVSDATAETRVEVGGTDSRVWLLWFTSLPPDDGGFRATVTNVTVRAR